MENNIEFTLYRNDRVICKTNDIDTLVNEVMKIYKEYNILYEDESRNFLYKHIKEDLYCKGKYVLTITDKDRIVIQNDKLYKLINMIGVYGKKI